MYDTRQQQRRAPIPADSPGSDKPDRSGGVLYRAVYSQRSQAVRGIRCQPPYDPQCGGGIGGAGDPGFTQGKRSVCKDSEDLL